MEDLERERKLAEVLAGDQGEKTPSRFWSIELERVLAAFSEDDLLGGGSLEKLAGEISYSATYYLEHEVYPNISFGMLPISFLQAKLRFARGGDILRRMGVEAYGRHPRELLSQYDHEEHFIAEYVIEIAREAGYLLLRAERKRIKDALGKALSLP